MWCRESHLTIISGLITTFFAGNVMQVGSSVCGRGMVFQHTTILPLAKGCRRGWDPSPLEVAGDDVKSLWRTPQGVLSRKRWQKVLPSLPVQSWSGRACQPPLPCLEPIEPTNHVINFKGSRSLGRAELLLELVINFSALGSVLAVPSILLHFSTMPSLDDIETFRV